MKIDVFVHLQDPDLGRRLDKALGMLAQITKGLVGMSGELTLLLSKVTPLTNAVTAMSTVMDTIVKLIRDNAEDPAALLAAANELEANTQKIVASTLTGTGVIPPVPPPV